jgi:hypothetical protein
MNKVIRYSLICFFLVGCTSDLEFEYQEKLSEVQTVPEAIELVWEVVNTDPDESRRRLAWLWDKSISELPNGNIFNDPCVRSTIVSIAVSDNVEYVEQLFYIKKQANGKNEKRVQMCLMDTMALIADDESMLYLAKKAAGGDAQLSGHALQKLRLIHEHGDESRRQQLMHITSRYNVDL